METLIRAVDVFFWVLYIMLLARIILSWFPMARGNRLFGVLHSLTEPILAPIRNLVQRSPLGGPGMMIDFSPIIAFILLRLISSLVVSFLRGLM